MKRLGFAANRLEPEQDAEWRLSEIVYSGLCRTAGRGNRPRKKVLH